MISIELENFNIRQIMGSGQCFRMDETDTDGFAVIAGKKYVEVRQKGQVVDFDCSQEDFLFFWIPYFDLDADYSRYIQAVNPRDRYLCAAVQHGQGIRILRQDLWEMLITFLISQQNNIRRIRRCIENICTQYGERIILPDGREYYGFPKPQALAAASEEDLRACNLGYRAKYVHQAALDVADGRIDLSGIQSMSYKKAREALLEIYGVGGKVADCICLFALHQLDAFPVDTHIRQVLDQHYKRGFPNRRYKGMRGVMQQYIFYYELTGLPSGDK